MKFHWQFIGCFGLVWLQTIAVTTQPAPSSSIGEIIPIPVTPTPERVEPAPTDSVPSPPPTLLPQQRPIVVIDPGHGGSDPGAVGIGEIYEKDIVLDISLYQITKERQQIEHPGWNLYRQEKQLQI